ncbi:MAG: hypothetical protein ACQEWG_06135 [Bacteroidota bacterium]
MENNNAQLTEKYKKEVADILSTISIGLSETVLKKIEPEIINLDDKLGEIRKELEVFRKDNVLLYKSKEENLLTELNQLKEDLKVNNTIISKIEGINLSHDKIREQINTNGASTNLLIENVTKTLDIIPVIIKEENSKTTDEIQNSIDGIILKKITLISEKLDEIESYSELKNQLKEMQLRQKRIFKFLYILLFMLITFFITLVSIFVFQYNQIGHSIV